MIIDPVYTAFNSKFSTMFYNHHFMGMHWIWWIVWAGIILMLVYNIIPYRPGKEPAEDAMDILKRRFAKGEMEREEFEERKQVLLQNK